MGRGTKKGGRVKKKKGDGKNIFQREHFETISYI